MIRPKSEYHYWKATRRKKIYIIPKSNPMNLAICYNSDCPLKDTCLRYQKPAKEWQAFHDFKPNEGGKCDHYFPIQSNTANLEKPAP